MHRYKPEDVVIITGNAHSVVARDVVDMLEFYAGVNKNTTGDAEGGRRILKKLLDDNRLKAVHTDAYAVVLSYATATFPLQAVYPSNIWERLVKIRVLEGEGSGLEVWTDETFLSSAKERDIVCGTLVDNFVLVQRELAINLACIQYAVSTSATWGEFKSKLSERGWLELSQTLHDRGRISLDEYRMEGGFDSDEAARQSYSSLPFSERMPIDSDTFSSEDVPGFCDGDWPTWPEQEALKWIPHNIQERFGNRTSSVLNGTYLSLDTTRSNEIIEALQKAGYRCERDDTLVRLARGAGDKGLFRFYAQRLLTRHREGDAQRLINVISNDSTDNEDSLTEYEPINVQCDGLIVCSTCFGVRGLWSYQNKKSTTYYQPCQCTNASTPLDKLHLLRHPSVYIRFCCCCGFSSEITSGPERFICGICKDSIGVLEDEGKEVPSLSLLKGEDEHVVAMLDDYVTKRVAANCQRWGVDVTNQISFSQYMSTLFEHRAEVLSEGLTEFCNRFGAHSA